MKSDKSGSKINISERERSPSENEASLLMNNENYVFYKVKSSCRKTEESNAHMASKDGKIGI